ncbi:MAG: peptidylprolyl isomerase [Oscillospiraceae bacterium]|nr:peptidylprolyl isomerase [Oscillospiraceae bacterium]
MFYVYRLIFLVIATLTLLCGCQAAQTNQPDQANQANQANQLDQLNQSDGSVVNDFTVVASIGGEPVALGEVKMFMSSSGRTVQSALEELVPFIVCRRELKLRGEETFETYKAFWDAWQAENADRAEALSHGDIVYGPATLSQRVYYDYTHEVDMKRLLKVMVVEPTQEELRAAYDERTDLFTLIGNVNMRVILLPSSFDIGIVDSLRTALADGEDFDAAVVRLGLEKLSYQRTFTASDFRDPDVTEFAGVADAIRDLPVGDIWPPIDNGGEGWIVLYCESREGSGRETFEECKATLAQLLKDEQAERDFAALADLAEITYDDGIDAIVGG